MAKRFTTRKYDGDDSYSWAVFRKEDLPPGHRGQVFRGEAPPIVCGCSRSEARDYAQRFETKGIPNSPLYQDVL